MIELKTGNWIKKKYTVSIFDLSVLLKKVEFRFQFIRNSICRVISSLRSRIFFKDFIKKARKNRGEKIFTQSEGKEK